MNLVTGRPRHIEDLGPSPEDNEDRGYLREVSRRDKDMYSEDPKREENPSPSEDRRDAFETGEARK